MLEVMKDFVKIPRMLLNARFIRSVRSQMAGKGKIEENSIHLRAGIAWLIRAQEKGGGGFARKFCLHTGWDKPYIETTGYIIPTILSAGKFLGDLRCIEAARTASDWLVGVQAESGAFRDIDTGDEQVFDTGQVLAGLLAAFREWKDEKFLSSAVRAGTWLVDMQEDDGSWQRCSYNGIKHTYYVKVAAALLQLYELTREERFRSSALKNIRWTIGCQEANGYFRHMQFRVGEHPYLHTIVYVLEGLLDSYDVLKERNIFDAAIRTLNSLKEINRNRDMLLCSQYRDDWGPASRERCVTGLAQWAGLALKAYELTGDEELFSRATKTIYYLKSKQYLKPDPDLYGALPGSVPLWGKYLGFCYPNWGVKFFMDALLAYEKYQVPLWREQEIWVSEAFRMSGSVVSEGLGPNSMKYTGLIEQEIDAGGDLTVLDIGCGKGKYVKYFRERYPHWNVTGIDPSFLNDGDTLIGSAYAMPLPDGYADVALLIEVMQHIGHMDRAVAELSRVIKPGGLLAIADRDRRSIIGFLKPLMEMAGLWMYPWDSPFREQWRSPREWREILGKKWRIKSAKCFDNPVNRIPGSNRFYVVTARKEA